MSWRQRLCAVAVWATSAHTIGRGLFDSSDLPAWFCLGLGGLVALTLIIQAGRS